MDFAPAAKKTRDKRNQMNLRELTVKIVDHINSTNHLKNIEGLHDEFPKIEDLITDYMAQKEKSYRDYVHYVVSDFHERYHVRYLGMPKDVSKCQDGQCKALFRK